MFDAVYEPDGKNILAKQVKEEIDKYIGGSPAERLEGAAKIVQKIRSWESMKRDFYSDKGLLNQAGYAQNLVKKHLSVRIVFTKAYNDWRISADGVPFYFRLLDGQLRQHEHKP